MQRQASGGLRCIVGAIPLMLAIAGPMVAAEVPAAQRRAAAEYVSQALRAEPEGKNSRCATYLDEALDAAPDFAPARWHSGFVRADNRWVKFDEVPRVGAAEPAAWPPTTAFGKSIARRWQTNWPWPHGARRTGCRTNGGPT